MNQKLRNELLTEAIAIGDEIIASAIEKDTGCTWITMDFEIDTKGILLPKWKERMHLYNGVSGIIFYLMELYKETKVETYKEYAIKGATHICDYCKKNNIQSMDLYFGKTGISFVLLELYFLTSDKLHYDNAISLLLQTNSPIDKGHADLLIGYCGSIIGLLKIFSLTQDNALLDQIDELIKMLVNDINLGRNKGIYWDRLHNNVKGLSGFAHGTAGIGFTFLELGKYFRNPSFFLLAEQAFLYEETNFNKKINNWADFRSDYGISKELYYKNAYLDKNYKLFFKYNDMTAWCHGASGIGLALLNAFETLTKKKYLNYAKSSVIKTKEDLDKQSKTNFQSHVLCHGLNGNAILFIEAHKVWNDKKNLQYAEKAAETCLKFKKEFGNYLFRKKEEKAENNLSLFTGKTGVGYFYLRCINPLSDNFILYPKINRTFSEKEKNKLVTKKHLFINLDKVFFHKKILSKYFMRTIGILEMYYSSDQKEYFYSISRAKQNDIDIKFSFINFVKNLSSTSNKFDKMLRDIFQLELMALKLDHKIKSFVLTHVRQEIINESNYKTLLLSVKKREEIKIKINPYLKIKKCQWKWNLNTEEWRNNSIEKEETNYIILTSSFNGISEFHLSEFTHLAIKEFSKLTTIQKGKQNFINKLGRNYTINKKEMTTFITNQINELLRIGILCVEKKQ